MPSSPVLSGVRVPEAVAPWLPAGFSLASLPEGDPDIVAAATGDGSAAVIKYAAQAPDVGWIEAEAHALRALAATDLPVPHVLGLHVDETGAWLVTGRLPGCPLSLRLRDADADARIAWCERLGRMLAKIHATEVPVGLRDIDATPWVRRRRDPLPAEHAPAVLAAVDLTEPPAERPVLVHGDFTPDNVLADGDRISGVIDWPGAGTGASEYDLATALLSLRTLVDEAAVAAFVRGYVDAVG